MAEVDLEVSLQTDQASLFHLLMEATAEAEGGGGGGRHWLSRDTCLWGGQRISTRAGMVPHV